MAPRTRKRFTRIAVVVIVLGAVREVSIRRHETALHDWPRPNS